MIIKEIRVVRLDLPPRSSRPASAGALEIATPMSRYPRFKADRASWIPPWKTVWCQVIAEDGTWGLGMTGFGRPVAAVIADHLAPKLLGEDVFATEKLWDMMFRLTKPYGSAGLAACAISALDLALWDLKGKLLGKPVYALLGGPCRDRVFCYATGNAPELHMAMGFKATKLPCLYGPSDGLSGLEENEKFVAKAREDVGDHVEMMLDCWMALDVNYAVRLVERLRPYKLKWIEECLIPEDLDAHLELRRRLPDVTLATGEHWCTHFPFEFACRHKCVDILQPDITWCGGLTACLKIARLAEAAGLGVVLHAGGNSPYGQHFTYAMAVVPWCEYFTGPPAGTFHPGVQPGVPLQQSALPGMAVPNDGWLIPSHAPGFGLEIDERCLKPFFE